jgi:hypothetical protein
MYNVHQHWDPLKVCIVGKSYNAKFYDYIKNKKVRKVFYQIAEETEEDYQKLINVLESFGVQVLRPEVSDNYKDNIFQGAIMKPPMTPRDISAMIGNNFYIDTGNIEERWHALKGSDWPEEIPESFDSTPPWIQKELLKTFKSNFVGEFSYHNIIQKLKKNCNIIYNQKISTASTTRIGKDLYFGTETLDQETNGLYEKYSAMFPDYRCHVVSTDGHADGNFCPVVPGLILSLKLDLYGKDYTSYDRTFPGWEVIYLKDQSWDSVLPFLLLKQKNEGKWWVPGHELNDDFTNFVEKWMNHWVGYVEETVFDVNILVVDKKNVICNNYNQKVFDAFSRYGITPHVVNFRHRYFWDGGLHCITSDVHREGTLHDYFPERI